MKIQKLSFLLGLLAACSGCVYSQAQWGTVAHSKALSWSSGNTGALFVRSEKSRLKDGLIYDGGDFSFRITDVLSYDVEHDSFSFWAGTDVGVQFIALRRKAGAYRGKLGSGCDVGLNDLGKLKLIWVSSGERFLFTEVNGAWRCVSVEDVAGRKLFIDYDRDGVVALVRDFDRRLEPIYRAGQLAQVYQSWPLRSGGRELAMLVIGGK